MPNGNAGLEPSSAGVFLRTHRRPFAFLGVFTSRRKRRSSSLTRPIIASWNVRPMGKPFERSPEGTSTMVEAGKGRRLHQLNRPTYIAIGTDQAVCVSDSMNDRVVKWEKGADKGIVEAGGHGKGKDLTQMYCPAGLVIDRAGTIYVADQWNERVMRWPTGATRGDVIAGDKYVAGCAAHELNGPEGIVFDREGNLYVADSHNHRVQCFAKDKDWFWLQRSMQNKLNKSRYLYCLREFRTSSLSIAISHDQAMGCQCLQASRWSSLVEGEELQSSPRSVISGVHMFLPQISCRLLWSRFSSRKEAWYRNAE